MTEEEKKLFLTGIQLFNHQEFYESHEYWEQIWLKDRSDNRLFYQGLIITAGGYCHIQKQRWRPAFKALSKANQKLSSYPNNYLGIQLKELRKANCEWIEWLENQEQEKSNLIHFPKILFV